MWRPTDWENPANNAASHGDSGAAEFANGFEAGADAMLEALKKGAGQITESSEDSFYVTFPETKGNGKLVFIPDDD